MINLSLNKLKLIAKNKNIKNYENKSEDDLIKMVNESKAKASVSKKRIKTIRKKFNESRHKFSKLKINEIKRNIYNIKKPKHLSPSETKEIEKKSSWIRKESF